MPTVIGWVTRHNLIKCAETTLQKVMASRSKTYLAFAEIFGVKLTPVIIQFLCKLSLKICERVMAKLSPVLFTKIRVLAHSSRLAGQSPGPQRILYHLAEKRFILLAGNESTSKSPIWSHFKIEFFFKIKFRLQNAVYT